MFWYLEMKNGVHLRFTMMNIEKVNERINLVTFLYLC